MKCTLCTKDIEKYNPEFHQMKIDESRSVNVCPECVNRFTKWQVTIASKLFPTKALKKYAGRNN